MRTLIKIILAVVKKSFILFLAVVMGCTVALTYFYYQSREDLPSVKMLKDYKLPVVSRVYAQNGLLIAEFAEEKRLYLPISAIPNKVIYAFLSAEDKNFFSHGGIDYFGIFKALISNTLAFVENSETRLSGASTITQQVAKNYLLSSERTFIRKFKEFLLAYRIESTFTKEYILELYLNKIYFGFNSYGVAAAAVNYFGKALDALELHEVAYLAALPKGPNNYHPIRKTKKALARRNWVLFEMMENEFITKKQYENAREKPLEVKLFSLKSDVFAGEYFAEEVRRQLYEAYGKKNLYQDGLAIHATLDPKLQKLARNVLRKGLVNYDKTLGWHGTLFTMRPKKLAEWKKNLAKVDIPKDISPWKIAVVLKVNKDNVNIGVRQDNKNIAAEYKNGIITLKEMQNFNAKVSSKVTRRIVRNIKKTNDIFKSGDVIYVEHKKDNLYRLRQVPEVNGSIVAMDPRNGRILAMVGGFSFDISQFNRAVQAWRQPGSTFKPFVYLAALENGYTPSSIILDAPFVFNQGKDEGLWRPKNFGNVYYGSSTLRTGVERSRNVMTVRLAQELGIEKVVEYGKKFGIFDDAKPVPAIALGTVETTLMRIVTGFAMIANGGKKIQPSIIDRIHNRYGKVVYTNDKRICQKCNVDGEIVNSDLIEEPQLEDNRITISDQYSTYQMVSILRGVVQRGTGRIVGKLKLPLAGKTGTTNNERDVWFVGFSPEIVVGIFIGFDQPKHMGKKATGGRLAAPVFRDFMKKYYEDRKPVPFRAPSGIKFFRVSAKSGTIARATDKDVILEAFKPNTQPPERTTEISYQNGGNQIKKESNWDDPSVGIEGLY